MTTWRMGSQDGRKWLVTNGDRCCPLNGAIPIPNGLFMAYKWGLLVILITYLLYNCDGPRWVITPYNPCISHFQTHGSYPGSQSNYQVVDALRARQHDVFDVASSASGF